MKMELENQAEQGHQDDCEWYAANCKNYFSDPDLHLGDCYQPCNNAICPLAIESTDMFIQKGDNDGKL